jgi:colicin import membrane protein
MAVKDRESTPDLAAIEEAWDSPRPPAAQVDTERKLELDAAADRLIESLAPASGPDVDDLDSGWGEEDEEEEEEEEVEPELPDERLDPVAYAAAKKARDERIEARKQRRRVKIEAKKARRKARADAARGKQKAKAKKPSNAEAKARAKAEAKANAKAKAKAKASLRTRNDDAREDESADDDADDDAGEEGVDSVVTSRSTRATKTNPSKPMLSKAMLSKTNTWMLAVAVVVFVAAAIFAAVVAR